MNNNNDNIDNSDNTTKNNNIDYECKCGNKYRKNYENEKREFSENYNNYDEQYINSQFEWNRQHEKILIEWGDKAICYRWLHSQSHNIYSFRNRWFTIPVIILSTLTGTANFAQERIPENFRSYFQLLIGSLNIFAGILTTIQQFLKVSELNEAHRVSSISWDKFYRNIKLEIAKSRNERMPAYQMLKISKEEFDRLMESSPSISEKVIKKFNITFSGGKIKKNGILTEKQKIFKDLYKPEICDIMESTRNFVFKESEEDIEKRKNNNFINLIKETNEFRKKSLIVNKFVDNFKCENKNLSFEQGIIDKQKDSLENEIISK